MQVPPSGPRQDSTSSLWLRGCVALRCVARSEASSTPAQLPWDSEFAFALTNFEARNTPAALV